MPDKKLTDNEIVKGLEICSNNGDCKECPINPHHGNYGYCTSLAIKAALDLLNRLQSENERLKANNKTLENVVKNTFIKKAGFDIDPLIEIKAEAYKEFAERLKDKHRRITDYDEAGFGAQIFIFEERVIDNLLKEMEGDNQ